MKQETMFLKSLQFIAFGLIYMDTTQGNERIEIRLSSNDVITSVSVWGHTMDGIDFTRTGYGTLGYYTLVALATEGSTGLTCNDNTDGLTISSPATMRALMGNYTSNSQFPKSRIGCASSTNINDIHNSPVDQVSAQQICKSCIWK